MSYKSRDIDSSLQLQFLASNKALAAYTLLVQLTLTLKSLGLLLLPITDPLSVKDIGPFV